MITGADLAVEGFEWYDGTNAGDPCCQAYYQKGFDQYHIEVTFYVWEGGIVQPNLKIVRHDGFQENVEVIGLPPAWTVQVMLEYCQRVVDNFEVMSARFNYERFNGFHETLLERLASIKDGSEKFLSMDDFRLHLTKDRVRRILGRISNVDLQDDEDFERILNDVIEVVELDDRAISTQFEVSLPTIERWRSGRNFPHPAMRRPVYKWLEDQLNNKFPNSKKEEAL